ncbi:Os07g0540700, partial [Oryza sativa Japonica Group]
MSLSNYFVDVQKTGNVLPNDENASPISNSTSSQRSHTKPFCSIICINLFKCAKAISHMQTSKNGFHLSLTSSSGRRRRRRWRRRLHERRKMQQRAAGEEREHLVPEVAPHPEHPTSRPPAAVELGQLHGGQRREAGPADVRRLVRRALRQRVHPGAAAVAVAVDALLLRRAVPPRRVRRRGVLRGGVGEHGHGRVERRHRRRRRRAHEAGGALERVRGDVVVVVEEEVAVGVAELAEVVEDERVLDERAHPRRVAEGGRDAALAGVGVGDVAAAERVAVHLVRDVAGGARGVHGRRRGGVPGEGGGEAVDVGLERAVLRVAAARAVGVA